MSKLKPCPVCGGKAEIHYSYPPPEFRRGILVLKLDFAAYCSQCLGKGTPPARASSIIVINRKGKPVVQRDGYADCVRKWNKKGGN